ncbi:cytochrome c class I [Chloroherpeton thalassium ATCC 35110]|uniref:Cytochrome c class I n=1 Tax=Chloroherpeton thalassium (strain ATCC 35110 / GB-78) TaxID=517418 RepID=B3QVQ7_CHLT3|nr:c-type cytochrome [Chloroherpeton thalassium]ACF13114.1 cytochrome c class I [Chloroherpeton thalassium ATCC 35110]
MIKKIGFMILAVALTTGTMAGCGSKTEKHAENEEPYPKGMILALSCTSCHGPDGKSEGIMPSLYGKETAYIQERLLGFQKGEGRPTVMDRIAKGYTEEEIKLIAEYFGNLK